METLVFAYGTLLHPDVQQHVIGRLIDGRPDRLQGYRIGSLRDGAEKYPNIVPEFGSLVEGRLLEVTDAELAAMDRYEGDCYDRRRVTLESGEEAWVYIGLPGKG
ncbi:MAG TPA: gamma-glutamylcyclotransferase [Candidatus Hydrogenedentes bacterium]|nr:gamma-glutamylcyclotransferase [Candidatus Hydrogenedentota bacterium]HRK33427.1 gamma-glutamylcyclotransferase [Candidatus Hydrogenedentota bacterium]